MVNLPADGVAPSGVGVSVTAPGGSVREVLAATPTSCVALGDLAEEGSVLEAAVDTGQLPLAIANTLDACGLAGGLVWRAEGDLRVADPAGTYDVAWNIVNESGVSASPATSLDVLPVVGLGLSFDRVDFGDIQPGTWQEAHGVTGPADYAVRNIGNVVGHVTIRFGEMTGSSTGAAISEFGAALGSAETRPIAPDVTACFSEPIGPNEQRGLRLLLNAGPVPPDSYRGDVSLGITTSCSP